ncbi:hypothetical protein SRB5_19660 [Streptomyces sp. RB5]|uniref:Uncharacterized protein n=1 Tax=Streptomyces smaragdinus TaxID=2585196 RepID=A0A7K0CEE4_9ACTN|nr:hypothetical protein [Streptomyces smaragdinus]MQY11847.1 hypothetical protein [Streptomyces smaragdinus]
MAKLKRLGSAQQAGVPDVWDDSGDEPLETYEMFRVVCPDCAQSIALLEGEEQLPEHARLVTPWNPFGLAVCDGSGRGVGETAADGDAVEAPEQEAAAMLLTLPEGLDWRRQPFSHVGGPGSKPVRFRVPGMRRAA